MVLNLFCDQHAKNFKRKELRRLQEESASPMLKKVESQETEVKVNLEDMKKEEGLSLIHI